MCCMRLIENTGCKNYAKNHHMRTIAQICRAISIDNQKKNLLNGNISFICRHNMLNFGPLMAKINWRVWDTQQISTGFTHWLRYCTDIAQLTSTKLCTMLGRLLCWYAIFTFSEALAPLTEFCQLQNSLCVQILRSPILSALLHGTRALGVRQTL